MKRLFALALICFCVTCWVVADRPAQVVRPQAVDSRDKTVSEEEMAEILRKHDAEMYIALEPVSELVFAS